MMRPTLSSSIYGLSRRQLLKAGGAAVLTTPFVSRAWAATTEINMLAWYGHGEPDMVAEYEAANNVKFVPKYYAGGDNMLALIAPLALVLRSRPIRAIAYFGGIGLTTQAFLTPVIDTGPDTLKFWAFWLLHMVILISAVFDLTVGGFRPNWKDLCWAVGFWFIYAIAMVILDSRMDWYYGYLGPNIPKNAEGSVLKYLGPWPWRPMVMMGIVLVIFVVLWLPFAVARVLKGRVGGGSPQAEPTA